MDMFLKTRPSTSGLEKSKGKDESKAGQKKVSYVPWVEKYRPKTVDEVVQQDEVVAVVKKVLQGFDLPNLLFYGPPGTGKTSTILAMARELFGDAFKNRILELNASDERGIQVVRDKVKTFAQLTASGTRADGRPCPPLKIVILDEADSMTQAAQAALRRIMEKESKTTRFCLICNYISRIIEPLTSRCAKFRFKQLERDVLLQHLEKIAQNEQVKCPKDALMMVIQTSEGDLRKAITTLQCAFRLKGTSDTVMVADVCEIAGVVPDKWLDQLFALCADRKNSYEQLERFVQDFAAEGYAASQVFSQLHDRVVANDRLTDRTKSILCESLAVRDHQLLDGADEYLQLMVVCTALLKEMQSSS